MKRRDGAEIKYRPFGTPTVRPDPFLYIGHQTGPGKRTLHTLERRPSKYSPAEIKRLAAERGVGRPPKGDR